MGDMTYEDYLELTEQEGSGYRLLKNGAIHDGKRIVKNPPGGPTTAISQSRSAELHDRRREMAQQAWVEGGEMAADHVGRKNLGAWLLIGKNIATIAMTKQDRSAVEAARYYGQAAGYTQDAKNHAESGPAVRLELSVGAVEAIMGLITGIPALDIGCYPNHSNEINVVDIESEGVGSHKSNYQKHTDIINIQPDAMDAMDGADPPPGGAGDVQAPGSASQGQGSVTVESATALS